MGVEVEVIQAGDGSIFPAKGAQVEMHYTGRLENGSTFDSSVDRGQTFKFTLGVGQVIKGWDEGVVQLSLGTKAFLKCSPDYAYGAKGYPPVIPPNSTLIFEEELISFK